MLVFCNNFLGRREFLFDRELNHYYMLIHKNASTSMRQLAISNPTRYSIVPSGALPEKTTVTVFIRDPIERFHSGLYTQMLIYGIDAKTFWDTVNESGIMIMDIHTAPQFWSLLSANSYDNVDFSIKPLSEINLIDGMCKFNVGAAGVSEILDDQLLRLHHLYTEDIVLYNQFLHKTATVDEIMKKIKMESKFIGDLMQYRKQVQKYFD